MKKVILLFFTFWLLINATSLITDDEAKYLIKISIFNQDEISQLIRNNVPVIQEFSDAAIAVLGETQLSLISEKRYTILDKITEDKNYYIVNSVKPAVFNQIRANYTILTQGKDYILISAFPNQEYDLAQLPIMLTKLQFIPITLSETAPTYPEVRQNPLIEQMVANVSSDSILGFDRRLTRFVTRYSNTDSCRAAAYWLRDKFIGYNCDSVFLHNFNSGYAPNVVAVKRGFAHPDNIYLVICGHFDAVSNCPGADDNASGTVAALEAARVMKDYNFEYSIRYIGFSGEEQGLIGSAAYALMARNQGDSIIGVFNFDMISYANIIPEDLEVMGKISNPNCSTFVNYIINTASTYVPELQTVRRMVTSLSGSDHHSFWQRGYVGFCGIEDYPLTNPYYHTSGDSIGGGFNSLSFCTNVIKTGVASLAGLANPIFPNSPLVVYDNCRINDSLGNNNGRWDRGETVRLFLTLRNIGQTTANGVSATIACTSSFVTITQNQASFGNIASLDTAVNQTAYVVSANQNTPTAYPANFTLNVTSAESSWNYSFSIPIGQFVVTDPIPDGPRTPARYWAYDNTDTLYSQRPVYNWVEIKDTGTRLSFANNDQVKYVTLPPEFGPIKFYGQRYTAMSISADGWIACGFDTAPDYSNSGIPDSDGPSGMIAVNWDDLSPTSTSVGGVWWQHNTLGRQLIIEWDSVPYYASTSTRDKFEAIIYDTTYATPTGDNTVVFQYMTANRFSSSTIGIEDPTETIGIQYLYEGSYHPAAALIAPQRAIKYTTQSPSIFESNYQYLATNHQPRIKISPNPFRGQTFIQLSPTFDLSKSIKIYNSSGRLVKSFSPSSSQVTPRYSLVWDGRDELGAKVGAGIYFVTADNIKRPTKVVYLH